MDSKQIVLNFWGGVGTATGANIMLSYGNRRILVDCGLLQGHREADMINAKQFAYDPKSVDFLIITHAHMDHIGRVPKLVKDGFRGKIISTIETKELSLPMLQDAFKVMQSRMKDRVIYNQDDISKSFELWEAMDIKDTKELFEGCKLSMKNSGHILGSAICVISCKKENGEDCKIAFTGDLGNSPSPLLPDTEIPENIDFMVMESVYGDRNHEERDERRGKLKQAILNGIQKGGAIVIPTFSIERTQVLLYEINNMVEDKEIPQIPVFFDSPLAQKVTYIYQKYTKDFKKEVRDEIKSGDDIFDFPNLHIVHGPMESKAIESIDGPKIILAGSGMSEGGRVVNHEAHYLPDPKSTIIFVGYQSMGSLGRNIQNKPKEVSINGEKIKVRATIESIMGYSSHKDSNGLVDFVEQTKNASMEKDKTKLKKVFVMMGEPKSSLFLCQRIRDYVDVEAVYPEEWKEYKLN